MGRMNLGTEMETVSALLRDWGVSFSVVVVMTPSWAVAAAFVGGEDESGRGLGGITAIRANPSCEPVVCNEWSLRSLRLIMPLKSFLVVASAFKEDGFWFQPGWSRVSSVLDGWFIFCGGGPWHGLFKAYISWCILFNQMLLVERTDGVLMLKAEVEEGSE